MVGDEDVEQLRAPARAAPAGSGVRWPSCSARRPGEQPGGTATASRARRAGLAHRAAVVRVEARAARPARPPHSAHESKRGISPACASAASSKASSEVGPASFASSRVQVVHQQVEELRVRLVLARQLAAQLHAYSARAMSGRSCAHRVEAARMSARVQPHGAAARLHELHAQRA